MLCPSIGKSDLILQMDNRSISLYSFGQLNEAQVDSLQFVLRLLVIDAVDGSFEYCSISVTFFSALVHQLLIALVPILGVGRLVWCLLVVGDVSLQK